MDKQEADKLNEWGRLNSFRGDITLTYAQFKNHIDSLVIKDAPTLVAKLYNDGSWETYKHWEIDIKPIAVHELFKKED